MTQSYRKKLTTVISCDVSINLSESVFHQAQSSSDKPMIDLFSSLTLNPLRFKFD